MDKIHILEASSPAAPQHSSGFSPSEDGTEMEMLAEAHKLSPQDPARYFFFPPSFQRDLPECLVRLPEIQCYCFALNKNRVTINSCHCECWFTVFRIIEQIAPNFTQLEKLRKFSLLKTQLEAQQSIQFWIRVTGLKVQKILLFLLWFLIISKSLIIS